MRILCLCYEKDGRSRIFARTLRRALEYLPFKEMAQVESADCVLTEHQAERPWGEVVAPQGFKEPPIPHKELMHVGPAGYTWIVCLDQASRRLIGKYEQSRTALVMTLPITPPSMHLGRATYSQAYLEIADAARRLRASLAT
jgi:hypothetical protein